MRSKHPLVVICAPEDADLYRNFPLPDEELMIVPFGQAVCSVLVREIDLILLDCGISASLGLQLLVVLKKRFPGVPVLFVTEKSSEEIVTEAFKNGAWDFFRKPLPVFKVRDLLIDLLNAKRGARERRGFFKRPENDPGENGHLCEIGALQPAVMKVVCYIESNFKESLTLNQMAGIAGLSKYHFVRVFNREVGMSPVRYLKFVRIQRAKELLKRTDLSVFTAALRVGFQDVSNFNKNFKSLEGCTPSQYRADLTSPPS